VAVAGTPTRVQARTRCVGPRNDTREAWTQWRSDPRAVMLAGMISVDPHSQDTSRSAYELQRASANLRRSVRDPELMRTLALTLAHVEQTIDDVATTMLVLAQAVAEFPAWSNTSVGEDVLSPEARALRWHLHEFAARLQGARSAAASSREWADELLAARPVTRVSASDVTPPTAMERSLGA
jgi:hypothetical protein